MYYKDQKHPKGASIEKGSYTLEIKVTTHYPLSSIVSLVEPQDYVLLTKSMGGVSDFYLISSPDALHELKLPVLAKGIM